jgi:type III secretory pathway lipoprotein EscJ|tara:strand:- start:385 stop:570 length:186 start_codon:yes stop_codon:yes gene_type:complete
MEHAKWVADFPEAIFLCAESMDLDVDLMLSNNLPYRQTMKLLEMVCYQWLVKSEKTDRARL